MSADARLMGPHQGVPAGSIQSLGGLIARATQPGGARPGEGLRFLDRHEVEQFLEWPTLAQRAMRAAGALAEAGVRRGDSVAIVLPTAMLPLAQAKALVTEPRIRRILGQTLARYQPPCGVLLDQQLLSGAPLEPVEVDPEEIAMIQFSSGSTVAPKGVALSHRAVIAQTWTITHAMAELAPITTHSGVSWLPLYHDMGLIGCVMPALLHLGTLTLIPPEAFLTRPALWLRALSRFRATSSTAPNFAFALCVERIKDAELEGCDLSAWVLALNGAEPVSAPIMRAFQERFGRWGLRPEALNPVYGLSEASLAVSFESPRAPFTSRRFDPAALSRGHALPDPQGTELVSVGQPVDGFDIEIRDESGAVLPLDRIGRIHARGPSLMSHYLGETPHPIHAGWLDTGDLGFVHEGRLFISGRAKDLIILRGKNHAPQEIEQAVDPIEGVRTGCSVAVGEVDEAGERLVLFVEVRAPREGLAEECRRAVLGATGLDPALVLLLEPGTLPRTSSGKLRRGEALRRWQEGTLTPPDKVGPLLLAGALAKSVLGRLGIRTGAG